MEEDIAVVIETPISDKEIEEFIYNLLYGSRMCFSISEIRDKLIRMGYDVSYKRIRKVIMKMLEKRRVWKMRIWRMGKGARYVKYCPYSS